MGNRSSGITSILVFLIPLSYFSKMSITLLNNKLAGSKTTNSTITTADFSSIQPFFSILFFTLKAVEAS